MALKHDFRAVDFFRKVRDEQAEILKGKTHEEIIAYFSSFRKKEQKRPSASARAVRKRAAG